MQVVAGREKRTQSLAGGKTPIGRYAKCIERPFGQIYRWGSVEVETGHGSGESDRRLREKDGKIGPEGTAAEEQAR